jgi:DNA-binding MarR family transcriptional regulator
MDPRELARKAGFSEQQAEAWVSGFEHGYIERSRLQETVNLLLSHGQKDQERWRSAGLTYSAVRELISAYELDEISFGKLVEEIRGMASGEVTRQLREFSKKEEE